jgi:dipeptidyl aminopeptidase/acylaminoacyl peptidase
VLVAGAAHAGVNEQCAADRARGVAARQSANLSEARYAFRACSAPECSDGVRDACAAAYDAVVASMPAITVTARDARGAIMDARVVIDGRDAAGAHGVFVVDPGEHVVRVDGVDGVEQHVTVAANDRKRLVFTSNVPDPHAHAVHSTWPWVVMTAGGAGVVTGTALTIASLVMYADVRAACSSWTTSCMDKQQEGHDLHALNYTGIGLIIGGATVAAIGLLWHFLEPSHAKTIGLLPTSLAF